jgi:hypothetical protein
LIAALSARIETLEYLAQRERHYRRRGTLPDRQEAVQMAASLLLRELPDSKMLALLLDSNSTANEAFSPEIPMSLSGC